MRIPRITRTPVAAVAGLGLVAAGLVPAAAQPLRQQNPLPVVAGAPGLGDPVWPELGNGGYDVLRQRLDLDFPAGLASYTGRTTLTARAGQRLGRFNLDLLGPTVTSVAVNGVRARWTPTPGGELVVTPARPLPAGRTFTVRVDVRNKLPEASESMPFPPGLVRQGEWVQVIAQPSGARRILAVADHPAQKAPTTIGVTAPSRLTTIANGRLTATVRTGDRTTRVFREERKLAPELLQIGVGPFTVLHRKGPHGLDLRYAVPTAQRAAVEGQLDSFDESVRFLEQRLGRFPGARAGAYLTPLGGELETQGLTLLAADAMTKEQFEANGTDAVVLHEVAHEWFGNSVSPRQWSDLWLNEGHAVYYQNLWTAAKHGGSLAEAMRRSYESRDANLFEHGPIARPDPATFTGPAALTRPYATAAYSGGALVLYALSQYVGQPTFERIERAWVNRHDDATAGTEDFIRLASGVAGRDLAPFLRSWLHTTTLPPMPGHPDWTPPPSSR